MIRVDSLRVSYGAVRALRDVTFSVDTGTITAVLGANGAGKTTLLKAISGLVRVESGAIEIDDVELIGKRTEDIARLGVGHVPEGRGVIAEFSVEENLRLGALHGRLKGSTVLDEQYERFPVLAQRRRQQASTLSGGERQMLAMARALVASPTVLLLDEPSLGLAPVVSAEIMRTLKDLCRDHELTVILVEQNAVSALSVSDRAVVLRVGEVVANEPSAQVVNDERLRRHYLGIAT